MVGRKIIMNIDVTEDVQTNIFQRITLNLSMFSSVLEYVSIVFIILITGDFLKGWKNKYDEY